MVLELHKYCIYMYVMIFIMVQKWLYWYFEIDIYVYYEHGFKWLGAIKYTACEPPAKFQSDMRIF